MAETQAPTRLTMAELAERLGARLLGSDKAVISGFGPISTASADQVTFLSDGKYAARLASSAAAAVIVKEPVDGFTGPQLVVKDVNAAIIAALEIFAPVLARPQAGIHPTACVAQSAAIGSGVSVGPHVVIASGACIGDETVLAAGVNVGEGTVIGKGCRFDAGVVIYHNCTIGENVWIQANSTIGSTGFGYRPVNGRHTLIPHNGGVVIEDNVDIGAGCCIDRAKFGNTVIGAGTKIDNLVHIAHNIVIGRGCLIAGQVGFAGSCTLGNGVIVGGQAGFRDHVSVGDGAMIGAKSAVIADIPAGQAVAGIPAVEVRQELKQVILISRLPQMAEQLKTHAKRIEALESSENDKK
jgi:UDP-3-O-[3-hydroxymyristoyl] glucosamine N-acyltransferase